MWGIFGFFTNRGKAPQQQDPENKAAADQQNPALLPDQLVTTHLTDMDINDDEMNRMSTARAAEGAPHAHGSQEDHLQIKIEFSLSGDYINKQIIQDCQMREEQVLEYFNSFIVQFDQY